MSCNLAIIVFDFSHIIASGVALIKNVPRDSGTRSPLSKGRNQGRGFFDFGPRLAKVLMCTYVYKRSTIRMNVSVRFVGTNQVEVSFKKREC